MRRRNRRQRSIESAFCWSRRRRLWRRWCVRSPWACAIWVTSRVAMSCSSDGTRTVHWAPAESRHRAGAAAGGVIVTGSNVHIAAVQHATTTIPIVFVAILLNESNPNQAVFWAAAQSACSAFHLVALHVVANAPAQFVGARDQIAVHRSDAVVVVADPIYLNERARLQGLLEATRLPVAYGWREHVAAGGLLSYGADLA